MNWHAIYGLGDAAVMAPAGLVIALWLVISRAWSAAILWLSLLCAATLLTVGTKITFGIWGLGDPINFTGISGVAVSATSVFAATGYLLGSKLSRKGAAATGVIGYGLGVLVGVSAIMSQPQPHSPSEVAIGCALGGFVALLSMRSMPRGSPVIVAPGIFALSLACIFFVAYGKTAPSEEWIRSLALYFHEREIPLPPRANSDPSALSNAAPPQSSATTTAAAAPIDVKASVSTVEQTGTARAPTLLPTLQLSAEAFKPDVAQSEFGKYCTAPISPSCFQREETYREPAGLEGCKKEMDEYINEALKYRSCLEEEIGQAVKNANDIIDAFKCRTQGRLNCPGSIEAAH